MTASKRKAAQLVKQFEARKGGGVFINLSRKDVASGLWDRIHSPGLIDQGSASLCGAAALVYQVARDDPVRYAQFVIDLYEKGRAMLGKLDVQPGSDLRKSSPAKKEIDPADWVALASIRDSANWFFDYQSPSNEAAGITMPGTLTDWFKKAGYQTVVDETNVYFTKGEDNARKASDLFKAGHRVMLFINADMLSTKTQDDSSVTPNHWVVLNSTIVLTAKSVQFFIYTWGNPKRPVPLKDALSLKSFLNNYYGYIACKY